ncbi:MAG TPA: hypothetical protein VFI28_04185 [Candidatus Limnocylindrales bacterium]|nr:hypothetical protein [Candidatus Limnocylindrales bacterium]
MATSLAAGPKERARAVHGAARAPTAGRTTQPAEPGAGVLPVPRPISPRGAIRRSLLVWGWGELATGGRRGFLLVVAEIAAVVTFVFVLAPYSAGSAAGLVFLGGGAFVAVWAAQALHAERRAARGIAPSHDPVGHGAAIELLWLAPIVVAGATAFWTMSGPSASPESVLAAYVDSWRAGDVADASGLFAVVPDRASLAASWARQSARLSNETIRASAQAGPNGGIDPEDPWASLRWAPSTGASPSSTLGLDGRPVVAATIVRHDTVRDSFLGLVPTTSQRLAVVEDLGTVRLRTVDLPGPFAGAPPVVVWRIDELDLLGERVGSR